MEEDLKIVEDLIKYYNDDEFEAYEALDFYTIQAIEHLLQAYKQQQEIIKNSVSKDKIIQLKDFIISNSKQNNIDLIPVSNFIKNINILLKGDE